MITKEIDPAQARSAAQEGTPYPGKVVCEQPVVASDITHNFRVSPDKQWIIHPDLQKGVLRVIGLDGRETEVEGLMLAEDLMISPDSRYVAMFRLLPNTNPSEVGIVLVDLSAPNREPTILHRTSKAIRGLEWSPKGDALYFLEMETLKTGTQVHYLKKVGTSGVGALVVATSYSLIDFFQPPVSRFADGQGPSRKSYRVVYGSADGLFIVEPEGRGLERVSDVPASGIDNLEWSPTSEMIAITYKTPRISSLKNFRGVVLFRREKSGWKDQQLYDGLDVHTLWWSPDGRYCGFATYHGMHIYDVEKDQSHEIAVPPRQLPPPAEGEPAPAPRPRAIRSFSWSADSKSVVIAGDNAVFLCRLGSDGVSEPELVYEEDVATSSFIADCHILANGKIIYTLYEDATED